MITDIPRCTKLCAQSGAEIAPGETVFSVLLENDHGYKRLDHSVQGWKNSPYFPKNRRSAKNVPDSENQFIGWWKHRIPVFHEKKAKLAPNEILLRLLEQLCEQPERLEMRYVLTLLLIRRRILRLEYDEHTSDGMKILIVYCPKLDKTFEVPAVIPEQEKIEEVQNELAALFNH